MKRAGSYKNLFISVSGNFRDEAAAPAPGSDHAEAWQSTSLGRAVWVSLLPQKREPNPSIIAVCCINS